MFLRYIYDFFLLKRLISSFLLWWLFFSFLFLLAVFLDKLDTIMSYQTSVSTTFEYLIVQLPYWLWRSAPLAFLGSALATLHDVRRAGELLALESLGIRPARTYLPILMFAMLCFAAGELGVESSSSVFLRRAREVLEVKIKGREPYLNRVIENLVAKASSGRYFVFGELDLKTKTFSNFWMDEWDGSTHVREIFAKSGRYDQKSGSWTLKDVAERKYRGDNVDVSLKDAVNLDFPEAPEDLVPSSWRLEEMTIKDLDDTRKVLESRGIAARKFTVEYQARLAWPLAFIVFGFVAIAVMQILPATLFRGRILLFGLTFVIGFVYWFLVGLGVTLANHGVLDPVHAAWGPHLGVLALMGLLML
ncbi:LptF/LptG family permease [Elusimicrobiota bacterium]